MSKCPSLDKIINYSEVYQMAGLPVPPYRMTCSEHKELFDYIKHTLPPEFKDNPGMLGSFYGVDIEVVIKVDPYL